MVDDDAADNRDIRVALLHRGASGIRRSHLHKEARTLAAAGFDVSIVAAHDRAEIRDGVHILPVPLTSSRLRRMINTPLRILRTALRLKQNSAIFTIRS